MIRYFEEHRTTMEPDGGDRFQLAAALGAGLIPGVLLLLAPRGSPWAGVSFFSSVIMGRAVPAGVVLPLPVICLIHLALAEIYGLIIARCLTNVTQGRAVALGGLFGLVLYGVNLAIVSIGMPAWHGNEIGVLFTHIVFGLIAGGAYRGLLRRHAVPQRP